MPDCATSPDPTPNHIQPVRQTMLDLPGSRNREVANAALGRADVLSF